MFSPPCLSFILLQEHLLVPAMQPGTGRPLTLALVPLLARPLTTLLTAPGLLVTVILPMLVPASAPIVMFPFSSPVPRTRPLGTLSTVLVFLITTPPRNALVTDRFSPLNYCYDGAYAISSCSSDGHVVDLGCSHSDPITVPLVTCELTEADDDGSTTWTGTYWSAVCTSDASNSIR